MSARRQPQRTAVAELVVPPAVPGVELPDPVLELAFNAAPPPPAPARRPSAPSSIKESILRWLEQQL